MGRFRQVFKKVILMMIMIFVIIEMCMPIKAESSLTQEEKAYIAERTVIKAVSVDRAAPLQYTDTNGRVQGISKRVLEKIGDRTGLIFEYELYDTLDEALHSNAEIYFGMPINYAPSDMVLSVPFLRSETILYINSSLELGSLDDKIYAAVKGSALPKGIKEGNSIYVDTREESLDAVEKGWADYGYGNEYSVAFYTLQNAYKNIITIPKGKESREYCIGFLKDNDLLLSIINKSINKIDENQMQSLILGATSQVEREITLSMIMDAHGKKILFFIFATIGILLASMLSNIRVNNKLKIQNRRYEMLARISNEYLYEYFVKCNRLDLSDKSIQLFGSQEKLNKASNLLKHSLANNILKENTSTIRLPIANGQIGVFKIINLIVYNEKGELDSVIGKLIDISEETMEREELITRSQVDGLTGLYNTRTTKELTIERIKDKDHDKIDALILIDCDKLKEVNDTLGHLVGNKMLEHIGKGLKRTFSNTDIIGRIGGDEFCVYIEDVPSIDYIKEKCKKLNRLTNKAMKDVHVSVSIGVALLNEKKTYEDLFKQADDALYQAKRNGGAQFVINSAK